MDSKDHRWAIVLAAGEGTRLMSVTRRLYGYDLPKQFAAFNSNRTLLQQTMDRISPLVPAKCTVVVVAHDRREVAEKQLADYPGAHIISQPRNIGTGPGVLLPLSVIKGQCPDATVIITPSDHDVSVAAAFHHALQSAIDIAPQVPSGLAIVGAEAEGPATDLGWILPTTHIEGGEKAITLVDAFVEKPALAIAQDLLHRGGLWNTLVLVGSVKSLWAQAEKCMPQHTSLFNTYVAAIADKPEIPTSQHDRLLAKLYRSMPFADFSRVILENTQGMAVVKMLGSGWNDCGTPERLLTSLARAAELRNPWMEYLRHEAHTQAWRQRIA